MNPMLSVCMITYNHADFISQSIESILMQKTDFPIELVIGEDCSPDGTREICLEYERKYPEIIRVLPREKNMGASANFIDAFQNCRGKYIALCEGDDYWTDENKLQKQVDFLEANPEFVTCFHRTEILDETNGAVTLSPLQKEVTDTNDLFKGCFINTCTCVFRNGYLDGLSSLFAKDWTLHILNSMHGKMYFMPDVMSVYRRHPGGWTFGGALANLKSDVETIKSCRAYLYPSFKDGFDSYLAYIYAEICFFYFQNKDFGDFNRSYLEYSDYWKFLGKRTRKALKTRRLLSFFPYLANKFISFKASES